jgi:RNA polymerase sigma-70 factor (ECF subfamily)
LIFHRIALQRVNRFVTYTPGRDQRFQAETGNRGSRYKLQGKFILQNSAATQAVSIDSKVLGLLHEGRPVPAFECLVDQYESSVYRLCHTILRDPAQAEDAAQETLIRVWKALPRFDGRAALSTWIYAIARNRCLTALSRRRDLVSLSEPDIAAVAEAVAPVVADHDMPAALLRELVDALPERYRRSLTLFYYEDRSVAEVAAQLGVPQGTIKTNLFRARAALLTQLGHLGINDVSQWLDEAV